MEAKPFFADYRFDEERTHRGDVGALDHFSVSNLELKQPVQSAENANNNSEVLPEREPSGIKAAYPPAAELPTQTGPGGIRFDFNLGARVVLPDNASWRIRLADRDTGNTLFDSHNNGAYVNSTKRYYINFSLEVWKDDELAFSHDYSCENKNVLIQFPIGTLGDILAWFSYADRFAKAHRCHLTCAMSELIIPILRDAYPDIRFVTHDDVRNQHLADSFYATYSLGLFFDDTEAVWQPCDFRHVGLHRTAGYILGVDPVEEPPRLALTDDTRPIVEPYIVIGTQSSSQAKYWNNPYGWREVIVFLKNAGYRVICIDQKAAHGSDLVWNHVPHGAEDETGDRPLMERARWLRHAAAFIGLSSGLSWLAWASGTPVVLISGFTHPTNEFDTPYRVINYHACNSCWNDPRLRFNHADFLWCPRHAGTSRQFECTRLITPMQVRAALERIPHFLPMPQPSV